MRWPRAIQLGVLLAVLAVGLPGMASGQVRVRDATEQDDITAKLRWRDLQSGRISVDRVTENCPLVQGASAPAGTAESNRLVPQFQNAQESPNCMFRDLVRIDFVNSADAPARCTGVMIAGHLVLTAAHCACGKLSSYKLRQHRERKFSPDGRDITPKRVLSQPPFLFDGYFCNLPPELQAGRDLAILAVELPEDKEARANGSFRQQFGDKEALNIATAGQIFADGEETTTLVGAGYGEIDDRSLPNRPYFAAIPIASLFCAHGRFAGSICSAYREFVLADSLNRHSGRLSDSCGGDSGAPIMYMPPDVPPNPEKPGAKGSQGIMLVGITSRGLRGVSHQTSSRCGGGGIYTAVGHPDVVAWLRTFNIDIFNLLPNAQGDVP